MTYLLSFTCSPAIIDHAHISLLTTNVDQLYKNSVHKLYYPILNFIKSSFLQVLKSKLHRNFPYSGGNIVIWDIELFVDF
jgi:hypothetical protein